MKKVLLTSTALVAFAGAAAAEVTISGWAEMGVIGGSDQTTQFWNDVDVDFTMTGETDGGLTFGANVDLDTAAEDTKNMGNTRGEINDFSVFVSGEWGTVTMGDVDGAMDWAIAGPDSWGNPGSIDDSETEHWGRHDQYLDGSYDGQVLRYDYSFNDFGFAVSLEQDDSSDRELDGAHADRDRWDYNWAIGAKWEPVVGPGTLKLGIAYQQADNGKLAKGLSDSMVDDLADAYDALTPAQQAEVDAIGGYDSANDDLVINLGEDTSVWGLSAGYVMDNGLQFGGVYSQWDGDGFDDGTYWGLGIGYEWEAFSIHANYGEHNFDLNGGGDITLKGAGLAAGYDLGGGLSVLGGYGWSKYDLDVGELDGDEDFDTWSLGLKMAF